MFTQTPYSNDIVATGNIIDAQKRIINATKNKANKKTEYQAALKAIAAAQEKLDDLKAKETAWQNKKKESKDASVGASKQVDLDLALATNDKSKADSIAKTMSGLGVQPMGLDGKPLPGFTVSSGGSTPELRYGPNGESLVPGTAAYQAGSKIKPATPAAPVPAKVAGDKKAAADKAVADKELALKTMYVDYLRTTFSGLENKDQKAQIDGLFDKASKEGWTAEQFQMQLEGTAWWQSTLPSLRSWYLNTHDPRKQADTVELVRNKVASVSSYLEQLGVTVQGIDPVTGKAFDKTGYVSGIAQQAIENGWDDNQLKDYLATQSPIMFTGGGEIGSSLSKIRDTAYAYGVKLDPTYEKMINNSLLDSSDGRDANYYIAEMRRQALENPNNKPFAEALNSGRTLYEATRSYRNQMANLLEVDESNVTWDDLMKKTIDSTTGVARTFADFTKQVKTDPLWQTTKNAKETYSSTALDLAKMFGLVG